MLQKVENRQLPLSGKVWSAIRALCARVVAVEEADRAVVARMEAAEARVQELEQELVQMRSGAEAAEARMLESVVGLVTARIEELTTGAEELRAQLTAVGPATVATSREEWTAAVERVEQEVRGVVEQVRNAERAAELMVAGVIDDVAGLTERVAAHEAHPVVAPAAIDRLESLVASGQERVERLEVRAGEIGDLLESGAQALREVTDAGAEQVQALSEAVEAVTVLAEHSEAELRRLVAQDAERWGNLVAQHRDSAAEVERRLGRVEDEVQAVDQRLDRSIERVGADAQEAARRGRAETIEITDELARTIAQLPRSLLIDRDGQLVYVSGRGETERVGVVCGRDGASVAEARILEGELQLVLSDGKVLNAGKIPLAAAPKVVEDGAASSSRRRQGAAGASKTASKKRSQPGRG